MSALFSCSAVKAVLINELKIDIRKSEKADFEKRKVRMKKLVKLDFKLTLSGLYLIRSSAELYTFTLFCVTRVFCYPSWVSLSLLSIKAT